MKRDCEHPLARHEHGTEDGYTLDKCHCTDCRRAHAERMRWARRMAAYGRPTSNLVNSIGSARRIEALACLGWSFVAMGERLGWHEEKVRRVREMRRIRGDKAQQIADLYDELWDKIPPTRTKGERVSVHRMRGFAQRKGFAPPLAWDDDSIDDPAAEPYRAPTVRDLEHECRYIDEVVVEQYVAGEFTGRVRVAERVEAVRRLHSRGVPPATIAARLRIGYHRALTIIASLEDGEAAA